MLEKHSVASSLAAVTDHIYTLLKVINATANGKTRVFQNKRTECESSQFGSRRERIAGGLQARDMPTACWPYLYAIKGYKRNGKWENPCYSK